MLFYFLGDDKYKSGVRFKVFATFRCNLSAISLFCGVLVLSACAKEDVVLENVEMYDKKLWVFERSFVPVALGLPQAEIVDNVSSVMPVYIEGDGRGWVTRKKISDDPTPSFSLVLRLMQKDNRPSVYMARPCMYHLNDSCHSNYWTDARHAVELVGVMNNALDEVKQMYDVSRFELIGHSGGGAMAVLMAAKRQDISQIVTVAANLDVAYFTDIHHVSEMKGSLDPIDFAHQVSHIPQLHLVGGDDDVIPYKLVERYVHQSQSPCVRSKLMKGFTHLKGWVDVWPNVAQLNHDC